MIRTIKLNSGKDINLAANAATPFRFKQLFGGDLLQLFQKASKAGEEDLEIADTITQLAFVMNKQAERADLSQVTMDEFYVWLEDYEPMDFAYAGSEIINTYLQSTQTSVEPKKK